MKSGTVAVRPISLLLLLLLLLIGRCASRPAAVDNDDHHRQNHRRRPNNSGNESPPPPPKVDQLAVVEVAQGDTAVLYCPSNDEHHRFQFWWMKTDQIIGPGTALNSDKFRYEVLTGTLYIKQVTPEESGVYTCVCKQLGNISLSARSVQLEIKKDWQDLWANDYTVNSIRVAAVLSVLILVMLLLYLFYLTAYKNGNRTVHFKEDYSDEDSPTDRQMYRKTNMMKESMFHQHGIDNPTLEKDMAPVQTQKTESKA